MHPDPFSYKHIANLTIIPDDLAAGPGVGTGWFIASNGEYSIIATAGHVCNYGTIIEKDSTGREEIAFPFYINENDETGDDACLLAVSGPAPKVMRAGRISGEFATRVWYVGYPSNTLSVFEGMVSATNPDGNLVFSLPSYGGASGSPIVSGGRVVSMLVARGVAFDMITIGLSSERVMDMQRRADEMLRILEDQ